jgi:iron complex outermembrane recepter protein
MTGARRACVLSFLAGIFPCAAQETQFDTIVVESSVLMEATARVELDRTDIARVGAISIGDLLAQVHSVKVQRNSRGEQVFALRGSDQRQVALTLDGAPLVSAWDGQLDLSLLPTSAIQRIAITRGPASVLQGPNALSGAVNVISRRADTQSWDRAVTANLGPEWQSLEAFIGQTLGRHGFSAGVGWHASDGYEAGGESERLTGTDAKNRSAVLGWVFNYGAGASTGLTLLSVDNSKGVIPERTSSGPRFWRYPNLQKNLLVWYGRQPALGGDLDYSLFVDRAASRIDQYTDDSFSDVSNIEDGRDRGGGSRVQWNRPLTGTQELSFAVNWTRSKHLFRERASAESFTEFSQVLSQLAVEWRNTAGPWRFILGGAYEHFDNPDTGLLPKRGSSEDWTGTGAVNYLFDAGVGIDLTLARKTRCPSLRESYNGALGRFVLNPGLGPETAESAALGVVGEHAGWEWETRAFATLISDGIARISLPNRQFARVNQTRSRILGLEFALGRALTESLHTKIEGTLLRARAKSPNGAYEDFLEYRPGVNVGAQLTARLPIGWRLDLGARYLAEEHGLLETAPVPQVLPGYLLWNLSAERTLQFPALGELAFVLRLDNLTDEYYQTQWGLPSMGRGASLGVTWSR